jgi:hypothetical protein
MRDRPLRVAFWVSLLLAPLGATAAEADLVLYNAHVITVDPKFSIQSTVVVKDGKIWGSIA